MDVRPYVEGLRKRAKLWALECERSRREARKDAERIASFLVSCGATRVLLFGSLSEGGRFNPASDIDLAVEGISWPVYWDVLSKVRRMSRFDVDLVVLEDADPEFRERVILKGEDLTHGGRRKPASSVES